MVSPLAMEDIKQIMSEGGIVQPEDVIRLNALGLMISNSKDCELCTLPRFAELCGVMFRQPDIEHEMFLDEIDRMFSHDDATFIAIQGWVMSSKADELKEEYILKPKKLLKVITNWLKNFKTETFNQLQRVVFYVRFGCDPLTNEFPIFMIDDKSISEQSIGTQNSWALSNYLHATSIGIESVAALRATSEKLSAMIERAYIVRGIPLPDKEKEATKNYYVTLNAIREKAFNKEETKING